MNTRLVEIFPRKNYTVDATEIIDLNLSDPISQLLVIAEPDSNNTGVDNVIGHPVRCLEKIELVDGSDVLYSLNGAQAQGVDFYHNWKVPFNDIRFINNYSIVVARLNFGRYLFDSDFALDPARHNNLQLKIKLDIDGGADHSDDLYLSVLGQVFDQKVIAAKGLLTTKELKQYTLVASSHEYTDLPTDAIYKQLFLRAQAYLYAPSTQIDTIKLSEDQDKKIPINGLSMDQLIQSIVDTYGEYEESILVPAQSTDPFYYFCTPTEKNRFNATEWRQSCQDSTASCFFGDGGKFSFDPSAVNRNYQIRARGFIPHGVIPLLPDFSNDVADWYDVANLRSLRIDVKGGAALLASSVAEIIAQQLRMY